MHVLSISFMSLSLLHLLPGSDISSGPIWLEYITFLKSLPVCWILSLFFFSFFLLTVTTVILRAKAQNARQFALRRRIPIVCQSKCVYTIIILSVDDLAGSKRSGGITTDDCYSESIPKGCCYSHPSCRATLEGLWKFWKFC